MIYSLIHEDVAFRRNKWLKKNHSKHIKDHKKDKGIVPAGFGDGNILYVMKKLFANGYKGFFSLEPHLGYFKGLAELELDGKSKMTQDASADTFTLATNCFRELLKKALEEK